MAVASVGVLYAVPVCALSVNHTKFAPLGAVEVTKLLRLTVLAGQVFDTAFELNTGAVVPAAHGKLVVPGFWQPIIKE